MKKLFMIIAAFMLLSITASAAVINGDQVQPQWDYMDDVIVDLTFSNGTGTAEVTVSRIAMVTTRLEATLTVYEQVGTSWVEVISESKTTTTTLNITLNFDATNKTKYRLVAEITAYGGNDSESVTFTKSETYLANSTQ